MTQWIGKLMGIEDLEAIHDMQVRFAAPWAEGRPVLVFFIAIVLAILAIIFYVRYQRTLGATQTAGTARGVLAALRAVLLAAIVIILAEPIISLSLTERPRPLLLWLFDGTDSMNLKDKLAGEEFSELVKLLDEQKDAQPAGEDPSRLDLVRNVVARQQDSDLAKLVSQCRVRAYVMDRLDQVREIDLTEAADRESLDMKQLAEQLDASGNVTALGTAIDDLGRRHRSHLLAGAVIFSDFDQNAGAPAVPAAKRLGVPVYTVGVGPREVVDLWVDMEAPMVMKKDERTEVFVELNQMGLTGRAARVQLLARRLGDTGSDSGAELKPVAPVKTVELTDSRVELIIPFLPSATGRYMLEVHVDTFDDEVLEDNNTAQREVNIRDDSLKLLYVEHEPSWEWRFVKEVFHRDPLIGREGFRTFLRSADFKVRRTNELFLETLVQPRSEFFANDVIIIGDIPAEMLSDHFQEMVQEYVEQFGGGLVVIGGPRFGVGALANTKIGDMLPVVVDPSGRPRDGKFSLHFTPEASDSFASLGESQEENQRAWDMMGKLQWYQPVLRPRRIGTTVLANLPDERCVDKSTAQPIIATRRIGKGEVVYLGINEFWRLRKIHGEEYYRQFWGQLIYHLGLRRALGSQKRFQVYTDRPTYQAGEDVRIAVEAFNQNFQPLEETALTGRLIFGSGDDSTTELSIPVARKGTLFETTVPVRVAGAYRLLVRDPVAGEEVEVNFDVAPLAVERRRATRDIALQEAIANDTDGKSYELFQLASLAGDIKVPTIEESTERRFPLWNTWLVLLLVVAVMLAEWLGRKLVNLR